MTRCVTCERPDASSCVVTNIRTPGRKLFVRMCEPCYARSSVKFRVCNFCGTPEDDMYVVYNDDVYHRMRCCAACVAKIRETIGIRSNQEQLVEVPEEE